MGCTGTAFNSARHAPAEARLPAGTQWVDLDILHKFYPINKSKEEVRAY